MAINNTRAVHNGRAGLLVEAADGDSWHPPNPWTFHYAKIVPLKISKCRLIMARRRRYFAWAVGVAYTNQNSNMNNIAGQLHSMFFVSRD